MPALRARLTYFLAPIISAILLFACASAEGTPGVGPSKSVAPAALSPPASAMATSLSRSVASDATYSTMPVGSLACSDHPLTTCQCTDWENNALDLAGDRLLVGITSDEQVLPVV